MLIFHSVYSSVKSDLNYRRKSARRPWSRLRSVVWPDQWIPLDRTWETRQDRTADIKRSLGHVAARSQVGAGQSPILRADIMPQAGLWEIGFDRRD